MREKGYEILCSDNQLLIIRVREEMESYLPTRFDDSINLWEGESGYNRDWHALFTSSEKHTEYLEGLAEGLAIGLAI